MATAVVASLLNASVITCVTSQQFSVAFAKADHYARSLGVCKHWNGLLEWWNSGMENFKNYITLLLIVKIKLMEAFEFPIW